MAQHRISSATTLKAIKRGDTLWLADMANSSGVNETTARRLLQTQIDEGFVLRDVACKRYTLGDTAVLAGLATRGCDHVRQRVRPATVRLVRLAALSGHPLQLPTRQGLASACVGREFGSLPSRANDLDIGSRRPLGAGAGSFALLAGFPAAEITALLSLFKGLFEPCFLRTRREALPAGIALLRRRSSQLPFDVDVERLGGIAVPVWGRDDKPVATISLAALSQRISNRLALLLPALTKRGAALQRDSHFALREG